MCNPVCFHCGGTVVWDNDFTGDDVLINGDVDGLVHMLHCTECGAEIQYYIPSEEYRDNGDKQG